MSKTKFFLVCLGGGVFFAISFFFGFGSNIGYPWYWALICLGTGLFFAVSFFFIWLLVEKNQKPISFENIKAQKKLLDYETKDNIIYEHKFNAHINCGKGLSQEVCEACIYFQAERIFVTICHFGRVSSFDIPYFTIDNTVIDTGVLIIYTSNFGDLIAFVKDSREKLKVAIASVGLEFEEIIMDEKVYSGFEIEDGVVMKYYGNGGDVIIPQGVKDLFYESFAIDNVDSITIPGSIKSITAFVFEMLKSLNRATLAEGIEEIEAGAFSGCVSLEVVHLPKSLMNIDKLAFFGCTSLKKIYYAGTEDEWSKISKREGWDEGTNNIEIIYNNQ